ncbi:MAG: phosphate ABC transporter permease subunit PstC [Solirubrobacteraceae bacterium]
MSTQDAVSGSALSPAGRIRGQFGDRVLVAVTAGAALVAVVVLALIIEQVVHGSIPSISAFGPGFLWHSTWNPTLSAGAVDSNVYGAAVLIYGTVVTSVIALVIAVPLGVAIAVYLSVLAHGRVGALIGPLVELLAAVPSVILGLWGIVVLAPFLRSTIEPALHDVLGWIPIFGPPNVTGLGVFTAGVVLAIMVLPIVAAVCRDLFANVPRDLKDGALALGMTRWEMIRGVVLDSSRAGIGAATILGLSRALGEAIAVTQVIGTGSTITKSLFENGDTLASRIAEQFIGTVSQLQTASLFYCALVLLAMELVANVAAQLIIRRFQKQRGLLA